jgi:hypothetical protein
MAKLTSSETGFGLTSSFCVVLQIPCVGFGFDDCVVLELGVSDFHPGVDYTYCPGLYGAAANSAAKLRLTGASVDLLLYPKQKEIQTCRSNQSLPYGLCHAE